MAAIDDLLARIEDPALRADLDRELAHLRGDRELGLVFERHLPEKVRLPGLTVRSGTTVEVRSDLSSPTWRVVNVADGQANLVRKEPDGTTVRETRQIEELVVVSEFGQAIYPGLRSVGKVERESSKSFHIVVNAENYHALETLLYTCAGRADVIYIDPPYNTGDRNWKYNNDYVDTADRYRHSKWLSFIEKRLRMARGLLSPTGSLVVTVDWREVNHLGVLLDDVMSGFDRQLITIVINPSGQPSAGLNRVEEYAFVLSPSGQPWGHQQPDDLLLPEPEESLGAGGTVKWENLLRRGTNAARSDRYDMFYPLWIEHDTKRVRRVGDPLDREEDPDFAPNAEGLTPVWPVRTDRSLGRWRVGAAHARNLLAKGLLSIGAYNPTRRSHAVSYVVKKVLLQIEGGLVVVAGHDEITGVATLKFTAESDVTPKTVWMRSRHNASEHGTNLLTTLIGERRFTFPKSVYAVEDLLRGLVAGKHDALVLDFFAGSGTTTHAVALLNREDGGRRRSILVTNNEVVGEVDSAMRAAGHLPGSKEYEDQGVFQFVALPRLQSALTGKQWISGAPLDGCYLDGQPLAAGFAENVEFFDLTYEDPDQVQLGAAFQAIAPLLWLMAGAVGPRVEHVDGPWALPTGGRYGVLFDANSWPGYCDAVRAADQLTHAFVVTDSDAVFQRVVSELPDAVVVVRLYESYLSSFAINRGNVP